MPVRWIVLFLTLLLAACDQATTDLPFAPAPASPPVSNVPSPAQPSRLFTGMGERLTPGESITGTVFADDHICFPGWDSNSPCRRFTVTAPHSGVLTARATFVEGDGGWVGDLFLVDAREVWAVSKGSPPAVAMAVVEGQRYDVLVMSYPPPSPLNFELSADVTR